MHTGIILSQFFLNSFSNLQKFSGNPNFFSIFVILYFNFLLFDDKGFKSCNHLFSILIPLWNDCSRSAMFYILYSIYFSKVEAKMIYKKNRLQLKIIEEKRWKLMMFDLVVIRVILRFFICWKLSNRAAEMINLRQILWWPIILGRFFCHYYSDIL